MNPVVWWPVLTLLAAASFLDLRSRRIPNWLVVPYLGAGLAVTTAHAGLNGLERSLGGIVLAVAVTGVFCALRGMGMGDLKLCAAIGAWVGPAQLLTALIATGIAGGAMALIWAASQGSFIQSLDGAGDLISGLRKRGIRPHATLVLDNPRARTMPYAPAIAIGTIVSFFST